MGYASIIWVYDDAIRDAERSTEERDRLRPSVGEAVLSLCKWEDGGHGWASVGNHGNAVQRCDMPHSSWTKAYLWAGNCLRPLHQLDDDELSTLE